MTVETREGSGGVNAVLYVTESSVYHTHRDCPSLNRPDRYWPVETIARNGKRASGLRHCRLCARREGRDAR